MLRAYGKMKVATLPFADATFEAHTDGFVKVSGKFHYGWDGFASIRGHLDVGVLGKKFNAEGGVKGCLDFVDWCRGVNALVSTKGIAVCMVIDYGIDDWRPGFGYKWGDALPTAVLLRLLARPVPREDQPRSRGLARGAGRSMSRRAFPEPRSSPPAPARRRRSPSSAPRASASRRPTT